MKKSSHRCIYIAHRGASGHEPENTCLSIRRAFDLGAEWVEIDVQLSADGHLVVIHDERLERTTNGKGLVGSKALSYLRSLDAGKGETIPLLAEVLTLVSERGAAINIELKSKKTAEPVASLLSEYIGKKKITKSRLLVSSFDHDELRLFKKCGPDINRGVLLPHLPFDYREVAGELKAYSINVGAGYVSGPFIDEVHELGYKVFVFTVDNRKEIEKLELLGVDGIFTNYPEIVR